MGTAWKITISVIMTFVLSFSGLYQVYAHVRTFFPPTIRTANPPVPPTVHPVVSPPSFAKRWAVTELVDLYKRKGLEIKYLKTPTKADYNLLPVTPEKGVKFFTPLREGITGCILKFENVYDLERVRRYYLELNDQGMLYSWTFVKDNILIVLDGTIPEVEARKYENALLDLK